MFGVYRNASEETVLIYVSVVCMNASWETVLVCLTVYMISVGVPVSNIGLLYCMPDFCRNASEETVC